jgi:protein TonB
MSDLRASWGAKIHKKVQRNMRYPRGVSEAGTAKLALSVQRDGKLHGVRLLRSSGNARLDKAALQAVQTAGRFSKAPSELTEAVYAFSVSLTFRR